ncbi:MAG: hypothetical protein Q8927_12645 [Bacteroidota bacterium]|nr:hypothetical protein [Bacteroidota bacterium]MDP4217041.1 hypothetical protein [Bacteroidota bacterium]MDP4252510.1 hypothetical protein [Bacteroidota bacterium]MDP4260229.1 hypothetical protein [Bacteroidota bacterium]
MNQLTSLLTARCFVGMLLILPMSLRAQQVEQMMQARPVVLSGSVDATAIFYSSTGISPRYLPFNYVLAGSPVLSLYGWQVPFNFIIGKQQNSFTQPFNQFGLSPSYKWITVHAGYRSLNFSPFTLAGHSFLGAAVELNPGKFRFAVLYGQFNKATPLDTAQALYFSGFSYDRKGMAVKLGYGTQESYFDLIALKVRDDPGSVRGRKGMADSLGIAPAENMVTGYSMRLSVWKRHLSLESDGAISLYNNDIRTPRIQDSAFEKVKWLNSLATVSTSSEVYGAIQAALRYKTRNFSVRLQYRHVDPGYQTMGAYFLNNDLENYTLAPAFAILRSRLRFNGSIGFQKDDLANKKRSRSNKVIGSANLSAEISPRLGLDASFSNYSISQTVKTIRFADSLKVVESSSQLSLSPRYIVGGREYSHSILFSANISRARELNPARVDSFNSDIDTYNYLLNYQLGLTRQYASIFISLNHTEMKGANLTDGNMGATIGCSKAWKKGKLNLSVTGGYLLSKRNEEKGKILTGSMQARYNFIGKHSLHLTAYYTANTPDQVTAYYPKYTETRGEIGYGLSF